MKKTLCILATILTLNQSVQAGEGSMKQPGAPYFLTLAIVIDAGITGGGLYLSGAVGATGAGIAIPLIIGGVSCGLGLSAMAALKTEDIRNYVEESERDGVMNPNLSSLVQNIKMQFETKTGIETSNDEVLEALNRSLIN